MPAEAGAPSRVEVERTLTNGYAYAHQLEGRKLRLEARLRKAIRSGSATDEVAAMTADLARADQELAGVRALLSSLREQAL